MASLVQRSASAVNLPPSAALPAPSPVLPATAAVNPAPQAALPTPTAVVRTTIAGGYFVPATDFRRVLTGCAHIGADAPRAGSRVTIATRRAHGASPAQRAGDAKLAGAVA